MDHNFFIILMCGFCVMCSCSDTGNAQLSYNSPGGYLIHVLFSQFVFFPINGPGRISRKPRQGLIFAPFRAKVGNQWFTAWVLKLGTWKVRKSGASMTATYCIVFVSRKFIIIISLWRL